MAITSRQLTTAQRKELFNILQKRFEKNMQRHKAMAWSDVQARLESQPSKCWSLQQMEDTGGEPDVTGYDKKSGVYTFYDCAAESPKGRRSLCYDRQALEERKEFKPANTAMDMAEQMGISIMTEEQYRHLQQLGVFDLKTSSWIQTPEAIRELGGALFCDRRYDHVFVYHNGASSYYAARGFRGVLLV